MLVAFLGTHLPLLSLLLHFLISNSFSLDMTVRVLAITLVATLVGTGITLYVLHTLLAPVILTSSARGHIEQLIQNADCPHLYLPPYSPNLNPF